jgi:hypothetical protein
LDKFRTVRASTSFATFANHSSVLHPYTTDIPLQIARPFHFGAENRYSSTLGFMVFRISPFGVMSDTEHSEIGETVNERALVEAPS